MDRVRAPTENNGVGNDETELIKRRAALAYIHRTLPPYASEAFWLAVAGTDFPLEVLVSCVRFALDRHDEQGRNRLLEIMVGRVQRSTEEWARRILQQSTMQKHERDDLVDDLCADLYEALFRSVMDPSRLFWEENFWHCLRFERQHTYRALMVYEGRWRTSQSGHARRVPRPLMDRLSQRERDAGGATIEIEDECAQRMFLAIEHNEVLQQVLCLPARLKAVVLLLYWEGRTEKEVAHVLGITDRTVRNRLRDALKLLCVVV